MEAWWFVDISTLQRGSRRPVMDDTKCKQVASLTLARWQASDWVRDRTKIGSSNRFSFATRLISSIFSIYSSLQVLCQLVAARLRLNVWTWTWHGYEAWRENGSIGCVLFLLTRESTWFGFRRSFAGESIFSMDSLSDGRGGLALETAVDILRPQQFQWPVAIWHSSPDLTQSWPYLGILESSFKGIIYTVSTAGISAISAISANQYFRVRGGRGDSSGEV